MLINVAHFLALDRGCVHSDAEFQHFICSRDVDGTKADHANGRHRKYASHLNEAMWR
jgi:hypothetical protein